MHTKTSAGNFSLAGALLTLTLSAVPLLLLTKASGTYFLTRDLTRQTGAIITLQQYLETVARSQNSSGITLPPRIHPTGSVTLTGGEALTLSKTAAILPDHIGDALTWAEVDFGKILRITSTTRHGNTLETEGCFALTKSTSLAETCESFLATTRDGIFELVENSRHYTGLTGCLSLNLTVERSVLAAPPESFFAPGARLLIPITRINTLYRDTTGTLRIVGHRGASIQENQPVQEHFPLMRLMQFQDPTGMQILTITVQSSSSPVPPAVLRVPLSSSAPGPLTLSATLQ